MGVLDKFLNAMKLNDDDNDLDDEEYLDDEDGYGEDIFEDDVVPKKRILDWKKEDSSYDDLDDIEESSSYTEKELPVKTPRSKPSRTSKVAPIRQSSKRQKTAMEVCVFKPVSMEDCSEITETLLEGCTVILNMEGIDLDLAQRIIDFSCGTSFAIKGMLKKVSSYMFIVTPPGVDISGDYQEFLEGAFDIPTFGAKF